MLSPELIPAARSNCDVALGDLGLLTIPGTKRRYDITSFSPSVRSTDPRYHDLSLQQTWAITSQHRGRGSLEFEDPYAFYDSQNVWTHIRNQVTLAGLQVLTTKAASASVGGNSVKFYLSTTSANLWLITGGASRDAFQWTNGTSIWTAETAGLTADPTDIVDFLGDQWVAQGQGNVVRRKSGGVWSNSWTGAVLFAAGGNQVLYWSYNTNEIYFALANPNTAANRQGPFYVGDTNTQIRGLALHNNRLYIGKDDGLYVLQDGRVSQLFDFSTSRDPNNFKWMKSWQSALYFPIRNGLYRLVGEFSLQDVSPNRGAGGVLELRNVSQFDRSAQMKALASGKRGQIVDLTADEHFLYAAVDGGTGGTSQVLVYNGDGWHQLAEGAASGTRILAIGLTSSGLTSTGALSANQLWFGYGNDPYRVRLPTGTPDPYEDNGFVYASTGNYITAWYDAGLADVWKEWQEVICVSEGLTSTETVQVAYQLDDWAVWQDLTADLNSGSAAPASQAFNFSPYQKVPTPPNTVAKRFRLRLTLSRGATTTLTPKVKAVLTRFMPRPNTRYATQLTVRAGRKGQIYNPYLRNTIATDPVELLLRLQALRDSRQRLDYDDGDLEPGVTNLLLNPQIRSVASGVYTTTAAALSPWTENGGPSSGFHIYRKTTGCLVSWGMTGVGGTASRGIYQNVSGLVIGTRYTFSAYVHWRNGNAAPDDAVSLYVYGAAGLGGGVTATSPRSSRTYGWVRLEVTFTATATTHSFYIGNTSSSANFAFNACATQLETTSDARFANYAVRASRYLDGDQSDAHWSGQPHASTSIRQSTWRVFVTNVSELEEHRPSIPQWIRGVGAEQRVTLTVAQATDGQP